MRVPDRRVRRCRAAPGGAFEPRCQYGGASGCRVLAHGSVHDAGSEPAAPLPPVSATSGIWASTGRRIRQKRKRGANTSGSGRRSADRAIEELIDLPLMSDPASLATMDVLTKLGPAALFTDANLFCLAVCRAVNLSLEHGNSDGSCCGLCFGSVGRRTAVRRLRSRVSVRPARL